MKNTVLNQKQRDLVKEYYEFSKTVVASNFHFADGKEISTGYSLEDAYQEGRSLSYRILTDKIFRHQPMTVIADRHHLKKSSAYRRLNEARGDFYRSYLLNGEQALSA